MIKSPLNKSGSTTKFIEELIMQSSPKPINKIPSTTSSKYNDTMNPFGQINKNIENLKVINKNIDKGLVRANSTTNNFFQNSQSRKRGNIKQVNNNKENCKVNTNCHNSHISKNTNITGNNINHRANSYTSKNTPIIKPVKACSNTNAQNNAHNKTGGPVYFPRRNSGSLDSNENWQPIKNNLMKEQLFTKKFNDNQMCFGNAEKDANKEKKALPPKKYNYFQNNFPVNKDMSEIISLLKKNKNSLENVSTISNNQSNFMNNNEKSNNNICISQTSQHNKNTGFKTSEDFYLNPKYEALLSATMSDRQKQLKYNLAENPAKSCNNRQSNNFQMQIQADNIENGS